MFTKFGLPIVALGLIAFAVNFLMSSKTRMPELPPPIQPAESPFSNTVAGAGMVEPETENISIGSPVPGVVVEVMAKVGSEGEGGRSAVPARRSAAAGGAGDAPGDARRRKAQAGKARSDAAARGAAAGRGQGARSEGRLGELGAAMVARRGTGHQERDVAGRVHGAEAAGDASPRAIQQRGGRVRFAEGGCVGTRQARGPSRRSITRPAQVKRRKRNSTGW